jgi:hypothetical protein
MAASKSCPFSTLSSTDAYPPSDLRRQLKAFRKAEGIKNQRLCPHRFWNCILERREEMLVFPVFQSSTLKPLLKRLKGQNAFLSWRFHGYQGFRLRLQPCQTTLTKISGSFSFCHVSIFLLHGTYRSKDKAGLC